MNDLLANEAARIALMALLFLGVVAIVYGLVSTFGERREVRERLAGGPGAAGQPGDVNPAGLRVHDARGAWVALVTAIEKTGVPLVDTKDATLRSRLVAAGYTQEYAPRVYSLVRLIMVLGLPIAVFAIMWASGSAPSLTKLYFVGMIAALLGLYLPSVWIRAKAD